MIYCVEDERNIRELLVYTLHSTGFEAKGLENGTQLFEELGNLIPDLIRFWKKSVRCRKYVMFR